MIVGLANIVAKSLAVFKDETAALRRLIAHVEAILPAMRGCD
jgi:hypothetical protein